MIKSAYLLTLIIGIIIGSLITLYIVSLDHLLF